MVHELERAERVSDALDRVALPVRPVVHRVDAPRVARAVMSDLLDAVHERVAELHVGRAHVDLRAEHVRALVVLAGAHLAEELEALVGGPIAVRAVLAWLVEVAARGADVLFAPAVDVRLALSHELLGPLVELLEVVRRVVLAVGPVVTEPPYVGLDRLDVLDVLGLGVGVVEAEVAGPAERLGEPEVQDDVRRVADVEVAVGLGREAGRDARAARGDLLADDVGDEVAGRAVVVVAHGRSSARTVSSFGLARRAPSPPRASHASRTAGIEQVRRPHVAQRVEHDLRARSGARARAASRSRVIASRCRPVCEPHRLHGRIGIRGARARTRRCPPRRTRSAGGSPRSARRRCV